MLLLLAACHAHPPPAAAPIASPPPSPPATAAAPASDDATVHHGFGDVARWVSVFDDPARDAWQRPVELVAALGLTAGQSVADIGAGTGYLEPHLARAVGPTGRVLAIDIVASLVEHLTARAAQAGTPQVQARLGRPDDPGLGAAEVDAVVILDTWHHIDDRVAYATRLKAAMKPGGRLWIVDYDPAAPADQGPPPAHRLAQAAVTAELAAAGWTQLPGPPSDLLPYQYVLAFGP
ncbi:MAG: methyltransferase domain-containing protein [Myxococcota bacterium]